MDCTWVSNGLKVSEIKQQDLPSLPVQRVARLRAKPTFIQDLLKQHFSNHRFEQYVKSVQTEPAVPHISPAQIKEFSFLLPPLSEQKKIAKTLSTWDRAIETAEHLVTNAHHQKKSLMQQLLTGKKRFKEFEGLAWEGKQLGEIGKCITSLTYSPDDVTDNNGSLVLRSSNVQASLITFDDNVFVNFNLTDNSYTKAGDILVCVKNGSKRLIGKSAKIDRRSSGLAHGAFMTMFRSSLSEYVFQLFQTDAYYRQVHRNLRATINSINTSDFLKLKFQFPFAEEQQKIAILLNACDHDISRFAESLALLQTQKKTLMQQLLTGKRRVTADA